MPPGRKLKGTFADMDFNEPFERDLSRTNPFSYHVSFLICLRNALPLTTHHFLQIPPHSSSALFIINIYNPQIAAPDPGNPRNFPTMASPSLSPSDQSHVLCVGLDQGDDYPTTGNSPEPRELSPSPTFSMLLDEIASDSHSLTPSPSPRAVSAPTGIENRIDFDTPISRRSFSDPGPRSPCYVYAGDSDVDELKHPSRSPVLERELIDEARNPSAEEGIVDETLTKCGAWEIDEVESALSDDGDAGSDCLSLLLEVVDLEGQDRPARAPCTPGEPPMRSNRTCSIGPPPTSPLPPIPPASKLPTLMERPNLDVLNSLQRMIDEALVAMWSSTDGVKPSKAQNCAGIDMWDPSVWEAGNELTDSSYDDVGKNAVDKHAEPHPGTLVRSSALAKKAESRTPNTNLLHGEAKPSAPQPVRAPQERSPPEQIKHSKEWNPVEPVDSTRKSLHELRDMAKPRELAQLLSGRRFSIMNGSTGEIYIKNVPYRMLNYFCGFDVINGLLLKDDDAPIALEVPDSNAEKGGVARVVRYMKKCCAPQGTRPTGELMVPPSLKEGIETVRACKVLGLPADAERIQTYLVREKIAKGQSSMEDVGLLWKGYRGSLRESAFVDALVWYVLKTFMTDEYAPLRERLRQELGRGKFREETKQEFLERCEAERMGAGGRKEKQKSGTSEKETRRGSLDPNGSSSIPPPPPFKTRKPSSEDQISALEFLTDGRRSYKPSARLERIDECLPDSLGPYARVERTFAKAPDPAKGSNKPLPSRPSLASPRTRSSPVNYPAWSRHPRPNDRSKRPGVERSKSSSHIRGFSSEHSGSEPSKRPDSLKFRTSICLKDAWAKVQGK
ncbi:hypothetical protein BU26DRAFT_581741 [Trematosphaeria pertusa]|uniref:Uncharacterized protein n=1 Tax=Trematosphaeria pertusa TaxID=390896 RepID=A0A6A6I1R5_9PLEO|nr:uncharacterized protein BU26DRAFT_581741 [Trematosphaeria pertusa]KAF2243520.1 hypothetical protein BU26DRAFT_581741 [Trematosphaeria pertusa]